MSRLGGVGIFEWVVTRKVWMASSVSVRFAEGSAPRHTGYSRILKDGGVQQASCDLLAIMRFSIFVTMLAFAVGPLQAQVEFKTSSDRIDVSVDGKPFTTLYYGAETMKPYMYPLRTATGKVVTRGYPMESIDGESKDHPHHRGLWFTHGNVNGIDFWANEKSQRPVPGEAKTGPEPAEKGLVVVRKVADVKGGKKSGSLRMFFEWQDLTGKTLLKENRVMTFYSGASDRMMDFDFTLTAAEKVTFNDTKEGTFAIRLATELEEKHSGKMRNAEGAIGEKNVWGKRSPWVDYAGTLGGEAVGIAILDHPTNPRHPTYWHSRSYGLFAANIFGVHDFENDKSKNGALELAQGQTLRFRYRVIIHPGDSDVAGIADKFKKYSAMK